MAATTKAAPKGSPDHEIVLAGRTLRLRMGIRSLLALQEKWGLENEREVQARLAGKSLTIQDMVTMFWACTRTHHPELSLDDCLDLLDSETLESLAVILEGVGAASSPP